MITAFITIAAASIIAFMLYWTYYRFVKITKQDLKPYHKKIWWVLFAVAIVSSLALVIAYFV